MTLASLFLSGVLAGAVVALPVLFLADRNRGPCAPHPRPKKEA